ncbi:MAG TPA: LON peptidase substrate-binding domain-containing protein [Polyangia bacterium]|nr:LON peptidase substrate-binding domain-containing protein [Polyangia bacterium]
MTPPSSTLPPIPPRWARLPIFPLPSVQLFPHALLPLRVFEPRYRDMVRHAMAGERLIAIAALEPGYEPEYHNRPAVRPVIGVGAIVGHEPIGDEGHANIILRGVVRARIERELPPDQSFRLVDAVTIDDQCDPSFDQQAGRDTLVLLADQLALKLPSGGETLRELARSQPTLAALVDVLSAALVTDPDDRQQLLETPDVAARVDRVSNEIATVLTRLTSSDGPSN